MSVHQEIIKTAKKLYPVNFSSPVTVFKNLIHRWRYLKRSQEQSKVLEEFIQKMSKEGSLGVFSQPPYMLGLVEWPYLHNAWDLQKRVDVIYNHYQLLPTKPEFVDVSNGQLKLILDLNEYSEGTYIALDRAKWFAREGEVVLNLFKGENRVKSIAFTLGEVGEDLVVYVGAIQGIHASEGSLDLFKSLTKDFEGLRPRSLLIEILRALAQRLGAKKIWAISDENRHHRHPYFADTHKDTLKSHYDLIWLDHGGVKLDNGFFELSVTAHRRDIAEVSSNKRAMYRRRYAMLDKLVARLSSLQSFVFAAFFTEISLEIFAGFPMLYSTIEQLEAVI